MRMQMKSSKESQWSKNSRTLKTEHEGMAINNWQNDSVKNSGKGQIKSKKETEEYQNNNRERNLKSNQQ